MGKTKMITMKKMKVLITHGDNIKGGTFSIKFGSGRQQEAITALKRLIAYIKLTPDCRIEISQVED